MQAIRHFISCLPGPGADLAACSELLLPLLRADIFAVVLLPLPPGTRPGNRAVLFVIEKTYQLFYGNYFRYQPWYDH
jgi:hypothetical protein